MTVQKLAEDFVAEATGRSSRPDAVLGSTGGPAGNATLTAWTGLVLLVLFLVELVTLLDVRGLLSWHVVVGTLLIPPALLKTASTVWRIIGYYTGKRPYRTAGPPPMLLRILGPAVVASTLAVLGTGVALILVAPRTAREDLFVGLSLLNLHKASFVVWAGATGVHLLGRLVPAARLTVARVSGPRVPGRGARVGALAFTAVVAALGATLALSQAAPWRADDFSRHGDGRHNARSH